MSELPRYGIKVIYEDNHVIVAYKPAGVLSQSDGSNAPDMLTCLKEYIKVKYDKPGEVFLGLLHRLDRPVSGVMVFARTSKAASRISEQIRGRSVNKCYRAVVNRIPKPESGRFENYILKDSKSNTVKVFDREVKDSKKAGLNYSVVDTGTYKDKQISLVDIKLETGRSHQIRSQFASRGYNILGDKKYGDALYKGDICLQSYLIGFNHPTTKEYMEFKADFPETEPWKVFEVNR